VFRLLRKAIARRKSALATCPVQSAGGDAPERALHQTLGMLVLKGNLLLGIATRQCLGGWRKPPPAVEAQALFIGAVKRRNARAVNVENIQYSQG
jgi:hypothetical protein